jgi:hypothetical protein
MPMILDHLFLYRSMFTLYGAAKRLLIGVLCPLGGQVKVLSSRTDLRRAAISSYWPLNAL